MGEIFAETRRLLTDDQSRCVARTGERASYLDFGVAILEELAEALEIEITKETPQ